MENMKLSSVEDILEVLERIIDFLVDAMVRFENASKEHLTKANVLLKKRRSEGAK